RVKTLATQWHTFLEASAKAAADPAARAVFDAHRVLAALALQQPDLAVPALEASARDFPKDYNPPARLARLHLTAGRVREARASIDHALALVYGPRRKRLVELSGEIAAAEKKAADKATAKPTPNRAM
ncbi:MAG TPA: tetratricopeptide repeat protein, partial [Polyangia bacterium]